MARNTGGRGPLASYASYRGRITTGVAALIRSGDLNRKFARYHLVRGIGERRADAFLNRTFARSEARARRIKIGVGVATAVGAVLLASRARADTPGSRSGSTGPVINASGAVAAGVLAAGGYGAYRMARGRNLAATLAARPAMTLATARPAGMPAIPSGGPWSARPVMPPLMGSAVTGIPRIMGPSLARPVAPVAAARPAGPVRKIGRALTGLAILNGASAGYDRGGISGAMTGALSGATFGLSDMMIGAMPGRSPTASGSSGTAALAAARAASRDAGTAVATASTPGRSRVAGAPSSDGFTDAYTRTRNGRVESVGGYTTPRVS